jgi:diguanylate cyclase (GGDEF)-like protein
MLTLFRFRDRLGIGAFYCALGSLHFLETYLAATFYLSLPLGVMLSPGSVVLFSGKLLLLLLVYIREDAAIARQPIYGLIIGNFLALAVVLLLRRHWAYSPRGDAGLDVSFLDQVGWLMVWGTTLLYVDCLLMILVYERMSRRLGGRTTLKIWVTTALVLSFDQAGFFAALNVFLDVPWMAGLGGWIGKLAAAGLYSLMIGGYLRFVERDNGFSDAPRRLGDLFDVLTYRQRYEALRDAARRDALTGVFHRGELEPLGQELLDLTGRTGEPFSLILLDLDGFKQVNDAHGHPVGDAVLARVAATIAGSVRDRDRVIRYGGDEFAVLARGTGSDEAGHLAGRIEAAIATMSTPDIDGAITATSGAATAPEDGDSLGKLIAAADRRLYVEKRRAAV